MNGKPQYRVSGAYIFSGKNGRRQMLATLEQDHRQAGLTKGKMVRTSWIISESADGLQIETRNTVYLLDARAVQ